MNLESSLEKVRGVGPKTLEKLHDARIFSVKDILTFFPRKYEDFASMINLSDIKPGKVLFKAKCEKVSLRRVRRGMTIVEAVLTDGTEKIQAVWFNQAYRVKQLKSDEEFFFSGNFEFKYNKYQLMNPKVLKHAELPESKNFKGENGEIVPIYRQVKGLKTDKFRAILTELKPLMKMLPETLPLKIINEQRLISRADAILQIHFPKSADEFDRALERLAFEEIFEIMLAAQLNKIENAKLEGYEIRFSAQNTKRFVDDLPFDLTNVQRISAWEIIQDISSGVPMNRLLQGDVGSGKTVVAAISAFSAVQAGYQVVLLAPTEILASQHAETFNKLLAKTGRNVAFLSGSVKASAKKVLYEKAANGEVDILIGTHAVLQDKLRFKKLGLVIIDEQHRFGVNQRQKLLEKSHDKMPHLLSMTATPIPRSLQLTLFGDLSVSILNEKPAGRKPVKTKIVSPNSRKPMIKKIKSELDLGRQAFVIVPAISDNDKSEIKSIESEEKRLKSEFKGYKILSLHGKMKADEKEQVMQDFLTKKADILLSTTVIEVGVDVPNASTIVIENADRFGLAQLHQLRGRVGRGQDEAYAFLVSSTSAKPTLRLLEMEKSDDGFALAEKDLEMRGAGEIYGKAQSGELNLEFASLGDMKLLKRVRDSVDDFAKKQTDLDNFVKNNRQDLEKYQRLTVLN